MRKIGTAVVLSLGLFVASSANAQSFGFYISSDHRYDWYDRGDDDGVVRSICSGARAEALEARLRHEVDEDEIDDDDAGRIHSVIERLEDRQRHECAEDDRRSIYDIARRYDGIGQWIDREAHGDDRHW